MECKRPCYTQPTFNYHGMACFLKSNMKYYNTGMQVVVMIKDKYSQGKYKYVKKPVMYFIPNDPENSSTVIAYVAPGHDNDYNYMYLLSRRFNGEYNVFSGDHFTMGLRNGKQFDLHYTTYNYTSSSKPVYIYYDLFIDEQTTPEYIKQKVCSTRINKNKAYDETLTERCYFFDNMMRYVHNRSSCVNQVNSDFSTLQPYTTGGKKKKGNKNPKKEKQFGGDESKEEIDKEDKANEIIEIDKADKPFNELITKLESKIGDIPNLDTIEMHIMKDNKGIITYCLDDNNVKSMYISRDEVKEVTGSFLTYYSLPFNFETFEFISIEELVEIINPSVKVQPNNIKVPLDNLVLCNEGLDYDKIIQMNKTPITQVRSCKNIARQNTSYLKSAVQVSAGGKNKKINKSKDLPPFKYA